MTYKTGSESVPHWVMGTNEEGTTAAILSFMPEVLEPVAEEDPTETEEPLGEYIFVLDRSGSMMGDRIALAKDAAMFFLKSLPSTSKFNIVSFGSQFTSMFPESVDYNDETMSEALKEIRFFDANLGGTEILTPLKHIFEQP